MESFVRDALGYAKRGCHVFPCKLNKHPITPHGFQDATTDRATIIQWWNETPNASIGIACGATRWLVLDIDADKQGFESYAELRDRAILTPDDLDTFTTRTGSGGMHIVWTQPEGVVLSNSNEGLRRFFGVKPKDVFGLDIRGEGGYIIAPPSGHPSGGTYQIELNSKPAPAPAKLVELLTRTYAPPEVKPIPANLNGERALQRAYERIANATEGTRNDIINRAAWYLFGLVREGKLLEQDVWSVIEAAAGRCGYPPRETMAVLRSVAGKR